MLPTSQIAYPVNEIFPTLQGEGRYTGTPVWLLRLQGCPVQCAWCDTKYSWHCYGENQTDWPTCAMKTRSSPQWSSASVEQLQNYIQTQPEKCIRHLLITGGEPAVYDLNPLIFSFESQGYTVMIETSGTEPIRCSDQTWVTVSPKIGMKGGNTVRLDALNRANEIKLPIARERDLGRFDDLLSQAKLSELTIMSLQPVNHQPTITQFCIEIALKRGWNLSLQTHKFLNLR